MTTSSLHSYTRLTLIKKLKKQLWYVMHKDNEISLFFFTQLHILLRNISTGKQVVKNTQYLGILPYTLKHILQISKA